MKYNINKNYMMMKKKVMMIVTIWGFNLKINVMNCIRTNVRISIKRVVVQNKQKAERK